MGEELSRAVTSSFPGRLCSSPPGLADPYRSEELIDDAELEPSRPGFADAGLHPDDIDTGVVILTGEALRRENGRNNREPSCRAAWGICLRYRRPPPWNR